MEKRGGMQQRSPAGPELEMLWLCNMLCIHLVTRDNMVTRLGVVNWSQPGMAHAGCLAMSIGRREAMEARGAIKNNNSFFTTKNMFRCNHFLIHKHFNLLLVFFFSLTATDYNYISYILCNLITYN